MVCLQSQSLKRERLWKYVGVVALLLINCGTISPTIRFVSAFSSPTPNSKHNGATDPSSAVTSTRNDNNNKKEEPPPQISRRDVFEWPFLAVGSAVVAGELLSTVLGSISLSRPPAHEQRVADTVRRSLAESAAASSSSMMRVLEVGIGADCRLIRRGLYNQGIEALASTNTKELEITGIDLVLPNDDKVQDAQLLLDQLSQDTGIKAITVKVQQGSIISSPLPFPDGYFDAVICCLTLCGVAYPTAAVQEMKRLLRPSGGTFGYVEHVAVNPDEPYRWLEWQQTTFDPLQQLVADNCHLHRYTQETVHQVFSTASNSDINNKAIILQEDRFLVDKMWPVTSQACGVIQLRAAS